MKVSTNRFRRELLRDLGQVIGRLDTRHLGTEADAVVEVRSGDPFGSGVRGAYEAGNMMYVHEARFDAHAKDVAQFIRLDAASQR